MEKISEPVWCEPPAYKISVLLPTRGRTNLLQRSIDSLITTAQDITQVQFVFGFDNDDRSSIDWAKQHVLPKLESLGVQALLLEFAPMGYARLNDYLNFMARLADAHWLFFWNDDAVMQTQAWDQVIDSYTGQFVVQRVRTHREHPYAIFPILPRDWFFLLGHLSRHQLNDAAISQTAFMLDIMRTVPIDVEHDRADLTGNNKDETFERREIFEGRPEDPRDFNYHTQRTSRLMDAHKLAWYLDRIGQSSKFFQDVVAGRQDPWERMLSPEFDPNQQVVSCK